MSLRSLACLVAFALVAADAARAQTPPPVRPRVQAEQARRQREENQAYNQAQRALDEARWDEATQLFRGVAAMNGTRRDAALYWLAYSQNRIGQRAEALDTIAELEAAYPNSRYAAQARALEVEVRRDLGQPVAPEGQRDDLLKLIALQALQRSDPQRAAPMLEAIVRSTTAAPRLKTRALFLLARSDVAAARRVVVEVALGETSPEIQERAIDYVAARQTPVNKALLTEVYTASSDVTIKRRVMRAFTRADDAESLVALARREADPARKRELVQNLSLMRNKVALDYLAELAR